MSQKNAVNSGVLNTISFKVVMFSWWGWGRGVM